MQGDKSEGANHEYYVTASYVGKIHKVSGIDGPDGSRGGVALHQYSPRFSVGCFTFNSGKDTKPIQDFIDNVPDLPVGDKKPVRFIVEPREVVEGSWNNVEFGTKKWKGV